MNATTETPREVLKVAKTTDPERLALAVLGTVVNHGEVEVAMIGRTAEDIARDAIKRAESLATEEGLALRHVRRAAEQDIESAEGIVRRTIIRFHIKGEKVKSNADAHGTVVPDHAR